MFNGPPQYTPRKALGQSVPLNAAQSVQFNASGNASVLIGPYRAGHTWTVNRIVTTAGAPGDLNINLFIYRNVAMPTTIIDSTYDGAQATSETNVTLLEGEKLLAVWSGGTPGSFATIIVTGTEAF